MVQSTCKAALMVTTWLSVNGKQRRKRMALFEIPCGHGCHKNGTDPKLEECPDCGCINPEYDPDADDDDEAKRVDEVLARHIGRLTAI